MGEAAAKALAIDPDLVIARAMYQSGNIETWSHLGEIEALERAVREQIRKCSGLKPLLLDAGKKLQVAFLTGRVHFFIGDIHQGIEISCLGGCLDFNS